MSSTARSLRSRFRLPRARAKARARCTARTAALTSSACASATTAWRSRRSQMTDGRSYERGLAELGDGFYAYLQPDGSWGWSNAGLVVDSEQALLIDTLFD